MKFLKIFLFVLGFCAMHNSYATHGSGASCEVSEVNFGSAPTSCKTGLITIKAGDRAHISVMNSFGARATFKVKDSAANHILWEKRTGIKVGIFPLESVSNERKLRGYISSAAFSSAALLGTSVIHIKNP